MSPRIHPHHEPTPRDVGPGAYLEKKNASVSGPQMPGLLSTQQPQQNRGFLSNNLHFGVTERFKVDEKYMA